jgi:hypothetical protein
MSAEAGEMELYHLEGEQHCDQPTHEINTAALQCKHFMFATEQVLMSLEGSESSCQVSESRISIKTAFTTGVVNILYSLSIDTDI